ncbi:hypothetical protein FA95DRAFT_1280282 [Auriscalpium vulgare]|uniref:Uncharacterized protein n=1 Tax=Auriscalpium vulgare TaxID=40419 RepID=A0ACB8R2U7_9AGAM|nr:hypothetical protein FA95DRAFT_1280282 [Auriscalpium vulgare]
MRRISGVLGTGGRRAARTAGRGRRGRRRERKTRRSAWSACRCAASVDRTRVFGGRPVVNIVAGLEMRRAASEMHGQRLPTNEEHLGRPCGPTRSHQAKSVSSWCKRSRALFVATVRRAPGVAALQNGLLNARRLRTSWTEEGWLAIRRRMMVGLWGGCIVCDKTLSASDLFGAIRGPGNGPPATFCARARPVAYPHTCRRTNAQESNEESCTVIDSRYEKVVPMREWRRDETRRSFIPTIPLAVAHCIMRTGASSRRAPRKLGSRS